jgi:hypothetical protein
MPMQPKPIAELVGPFPPSDRVNIKTASARVLFRRDRRAGGSRRRDVGAARKRSLLHPDDAEQASGEKPRRHHEYPAE